MLRIITKKNGSAYERLLRRMAQRGVAIEGDGCMNRYVIDKLSGGM